MNILKSTRKAEMKKRCAFNKLFKNKENTLLLRKDVILAILVFAIP